MQKVFLFLLLFLLPLAEVPNHAPASEPVSVASTPETDEIDQLFDDMQLDGIVSYTAFRQAVTGYQKIEQKSKSIMTLIDFSKPSTEKRLYVLDMKNKKLLYTSVVSHGKNSGGNYATSFSNKNGSYKSSLGFYLTENTYQGRNGYSLVLTGLEKGINDQAKQRSHRDAWCRICQSQHHRFCRTLGTEPRMPRLAASTRQTDYRHNQKR